MKSPTVIESTSNGKVKKLVQFQKKHKFREEHQAFIAEGSRLVSEVPTSWVIEVFVSESWLKKNIGHSIIKNHDYTVFSDTVFSHVSDTKSPQGIMALVKYPTYTLSDLINMGSEVLLLLEGLQDPGNVGTIIRTAEAAGVKGVILSNTCVDLFNPKTVRSTMGSIFRMPVLYVEDWKPVFEAIKKVDRKIYATSLEDSAPYDSVNYGNGAAFLFGNEGQGLSKELLQMADARIKIPMKGQVESLNVAVAAALCVYEVMRQKGGSLLL